MSLDDFSLLSISIYCYESMKIKKFKVNFKTISIALIVLLLCLITFNKLKKKYFNLEFDGVLEKFGLINHCYNPHGSDFIETFKQEGYDYYYEDDEVVFLSLMKLNNLGGHDELHYKIPLITHSIYFPSDASKLIISPYYAENLKIKLEKLDEINPNWKHYLWTSNPEVFPEELRNRKNVILLNLSEFKDHPLFKKLEISLLNSSLSKAYLAEASDTLRLMALEKFGGIYSDMDYEIYDAATLNKYMKKFNFIAGRETIEPRSYYGNGFIASTPNHPIVVEALERMNNAFLGNKSNPDYIKYPCNKYSEIFLNGPPNITVSYFKRANTGSNNDIILPTWMLFNTFIHYKNDSCGKKFNKTRFIYNFKNLESILEKFYAEDIFHLEGVINHSRLPSMYVDFGIRENKANIYFSFKNYRDYPIIGADMRCCTWMQEKKAFKNLHYWKFLDYAR